MQVVIDIPEHIYNELIETGKYGHYNFDAKKAIKKGTPLPKGHGRLKDVDWIDDNCRDYRTDDDGSWCYKWEDIAYAPTIIEADKGRDMTFEEAKKIFLDRGLVEVEGGAIVDGDKWREACYVISQWLRQQPCEDAISRQEAIKLGYDLSQIDGEHYEQSWMVVDVGDIRRLPSVTPKGR